MTRQLVLLAVLALAGCADVIRLAPTAARAICGALGCACAARATSGGAAPVFEVHRDGTVRVVAEEVSGR